MFRMRVLVAAPVLVFSLVAVSMVQAGDGFIGIYADSAGTVPCTTVQQWTGTTLYVIAKLEGGTAPGITGAEFRIEVENPSGWYITYTPPPAQVILGNALDLEPQDPDDGSGMNIAFDGCREPVGGNLPFGTITVINISGEPTRLNVKRHSTPRNADFACPLFTLCDAPVFSKSCMTPGAAPPCSTLSPSKVLTAGEDPPVFTLELIGESGSMSENGLRARREDKPSMASLPPSTWKADVVGSMPGYPAKVVPPPPAIQADTVWLDWSFDSGSPCNGLGWTPADNRVLNDGSIYWSVSANHAGTYPAPPDLAVPNAVIEGNAAVIAVEDNCFAYSPGYANDWDNAIRIKYRGVTSVEFHIAVDTEPGFDGVQIELDPLCSCCNQVDLVADPDGRAEDSRLFLGSLWGKDAGHFSLVLDDLEDELFNMPDSTHCLLVRFVSDREVSPQDRSAARAGWDRGAGVIVDKIRATGGITIDEDFENWPGGDCNASGTVCFINSADATPFGNWGRLYPHVTDNDACAENATCSWLFSDPETISNDPGRTGFGPGGFVLRGWMDDVLLSPWINAPDFGTPKKLVLSFREFPGNHYVNSRISRAWSIRGKKSPDCLPSSWVYESDYFHPLWDDLSSFDWATQVKDMTPYAARQEWDQVQVRFRIADLRIPLEGHWNEPTEPVQYVPGPGPYIDRVRVGTVTFTGPVIVWGGSR